MVVGVGVAWARGVLEWGGCVRVMGRVCVCLGVAGVGG